MQGIPKWGKAVAVGGIAVLLGWGSIALGATRTTTYQGTWRNTTFGSTGGAVFTTVVTDTDITLRFDMNGNVFGASDPPEVSIVGTPGPRGVTFRKTGDPNYGDINALLGFDGRISFTLTRPAPGIDREEAQGTLTRDRLQMTYTVFFSGSGQASGTIDATRAAGPFPERMFFAQVGNGQGAVSDIVATNPRSAETAAVAIFGDDEGQALPFGVLKSDSGGPFGFPAALQSSVNFTVPALGATTISTDGQGSLLAGSAVVIAESLLGGVIRFDLPGFGVAGVGESRPLRGFIIPVRRRAGGINTGVAIRNVTSKNVNVILRLRRGTQEVATTRINNFPAGGHQARFIDQLFSAVNTDNFVGTMIVQVEGDGEVAGTALELGTGPGQFTALPVTALQ